MTNLNYRIRVFLLLFAKYWEKFGFITGTFLFFKFKFGMLDNLKLPNLRHPLKLRNSSSDIQTFNQIFIENEYDINFEVPQTIIDGGANIGLFAVLMASRYPNVKIICIEPDAENFELLKENVALYDNIFCENMGLWNKDTKLKAFDKYNLGKWGIVVEEDMTGTVAAISLDSLMKKYNVAKIDILKLDTETSEKQLFSDAYQNWLPNVKLLIIEFHDRMESGCFKVFIDAMNDTFSDYDYSVNGENTIIYNLKLKV